MASTEMVIMPKTDYEAICDSTRAKTGGIDKLTSGEVSEAINSIQTGIDTFVTSPDTPATESDIVKDKVAFVNGEKVTGTMNAMSGLSALVEANEDSSVMSNDDGSKSLMLSGKYSGTTVRYIEPNTSLYILMNDTSDKMSMFGDATADDVVEGKTFTSANGIEITGNIKPMGNFVWGNASVKRRTNGDIQLTQEFSKNSLFRDGDTISLYTDSASFGNATAENVAEGTTFTSANGLNIPGTAKFGSMISKTGSVYVSEASSEFVINTGLSSIESIIVLNTSTTATGSRTHYWEYSPIGNRCCYYTKSSTYVADWYFVSSSSALTINKDGTVTVKQYSTTNPIILGNYSWYAFGTE